MIKHNGRIESPSLVLRNTSAPRDIFHTVQSQFCWQAASQRLFLFDECKAVHHFGLHLEATHEIVAPHVALDHLRNWTK